jgi:hypothetical protein
MFGSYALLVEAFGALKQVRAVVILLGGCMLERSDDAGEGGWRCG